MKRFACAALLVSAIGAWAADEEAPADIRYYETATVRARPLASATGSVTVFGREEIEALHVDSVAELIRHIPGLELLSSGPRGATAFAQIQGADPNHTVVLLDGVPLNDSTDQFGGAVDLNAISVQHVERIEVLRGPASSSYGSNALGGVINVITRRGDSAKLAVDASATAGGDAGNSEAGQASILHGAVSLSRGDEERSWFVGATAEQDDEYVADDEFQMGAVAGNWHAPLGERTELRLDGRVATRESSDYPEGSGGITGTAGATRSSDHDEASLGVELLLGQDPRPHKLYTTAYRHELDRETPPISGPDPLDFFDDIPGSVEETSYLDWRLGWAYTLERESSGRLSFGAEARYEDGESDGELLFPGGEFSYDLDRSSGAVYVEYLVDPGRFEIELGARADFPEDFDTEVSPRVGVAYRLGDATRVRAAGGRAFKLPSFFALGNPPALGGNPDLEAEIGLGGELGLEHRFDERGSTMTVTGFYNEYEDLIDFLLPPEGFGLVNRSEVEAKGGTFAMAWLPIETLELRGNVTYQDVEDTTTGETLKNRPEWVGGMRVAWRVVPKVRCEADFQAVDESFDEELPFGRGVVPGYGLLGLAVDAAVAPSWTVDARIDNALDREYERLLGFPGVERTFRIGLRYRSR